MSFARGDNGQMWAANESYALNMKIIVILYKPSLKNMSFEKIKCAMNRYKSGIQNLTCSKSSQRRMNELETLQTKMNVGSADS